MIDMLIGPVTELLRRIIPDPVERERITAEVTKTLAENEKALLDAMSTTMAADAASEGWLARSARPIVVLWSMAIATAVMVETGFFGTARLVASLQAIPDQVWNLITVGIGGYMLLRSVDKGVKAVAETRRR